ncbi:MAG TPA: hypothetical protein VF069_27505 [Streptosporangiaceae bacterium]
MTATLYQSPRISHLIDHGLAATIEAGSDVRFMLGCELSMELDSLAREWRAYQRRWQQRPDPDQLVFGEAS